MSDSCTRFVIDDADFSMLNDEEFAQVWAALSIVMRKRALANDQGLDLATLRSGVSS